MIIYNIIWYHMIWGKCHIMPRTLYIWVMHMVSDVHEMVGEVDRVLEWRRNHGSTKTLWVQPKSCEWQGLSWVCIACCALCFVRPEGRACIAVVCTPTWWAGTLMCTQRLGYLARTFMCAQRLGWIGYWCVHSDLVSWLGYWCMRWAC